MNDYNMNNVIEYKEIKGKMMLIFYIICGCAVFGVSGVIMQFNRLAIYRRRIIRHFTATPAYQDQLAPFILSKEQEEQIKQCFLQATPIKECIEMLSAE